jgi:hypothetical protein
MYDTDPVVVQTSGRYSVLSDGQTFAIVKGCDLATGDIIDVVGSLDDAGRTILAELWREALV